MSTSPSNPYQPLRLIRCHYCGKRITKPAEGQLVMLSPRDTKWIATHDACLEQHVPQPGILSSVVYWIGLDELRTKRKLDEWDAHLRDKTWVSATDWWAWHGALSAEAK